MKKLLLVLLALFVFPFAAYAQSEEVAVELATDTVVETAAEERVFTIFVHEDCPHCQDVEKWVAENDLEDNVKYMELKNNDANNDLLAEYWEKFEIEGGMGWPFMVVSEEDKTYQIGSTPIMEELAAQLGIDYEESDALAPGTTNKEDSAGDTLFFIFGGLIVLAVVGYAVYSLISDEE